VAIGDADQRRYDSAGDRSRSAARRSTSCGLEIRENVIFLSVAGASLRSYSPVSLSESEDPIEMIRQSRADRQVLGRIWEHYRDRLRRVVRLRLDRRLQGRADPSDILHITASLSPASCED
jgi:hypothetical protein